jgi:uncharacterized protein YndB with AHSA1/START domain
MSTATTRTAQVYKVYIKATAEAIWDAITRPEWNEKYGYPGRTEYDLRPGGALRATAGEVAQQAGMPEVLVTGEVIEVDPPRRLVLSWQAQWEPIEPATRLTYEIQPGDCGVAALTVTHELDEAPKLASMVGGEYEAQGAGGGWNQVLSDLKTLLETGRPLYG